MKITRRCWVVAAAILSACGGDDGGSLASTGGATSSTGSDGASEAPADTSEGDATGADTGSSPSTSSEGDATGMEPETGASTDDTGGVSACGDMLCALDEDATSCCEDCGVCSDGATVRMETGSPAGAPGGGLTPGGVADTHAQFLGGPFAEVVFPFTIEDEPVPDAAWFWAQQFFFEGTDQGGYIGVQSTGILGGQVVGKMVIGSIWDALEAMPGPMASCEPFGGEGVGYSCRLAFQWRQNVTYRMIVREASDDWWEIAMHDPTTNEEILLGTIRVAPEWGRIRPPTAGFAEYYSTVASCDAMPHAIALLHAPSADGTDPTAVTAGTYGPCAAQATSTCTGPLCQ
jgi:hypothetical protein